MHGVEQAPKDEKYSVCFAVTVDAADAVLDLADCCSNTKSAGFAANAEAFPGYALGGPVPVA